MKKRYNSPMVIMTEPFAREDILSMSETAGDMRTVDLSNEEFWQG